jgi:hypothetical protein
MKIPVLGLVALATIMTVTLIFSMTQINASENVKWKTFKDKDNLYTLKYPSNWVPTKVDEYEGAEITSPINMNFVYSGGSSQFASMGISADESIFTNATDLIDSVYAVAQAFPSYKVVQPMECEMYMINKINACSTIISYKNADLPGKPVVNELDIVTIGEDGVQYVIYYGATKKIFDDFLPVVGEMVRSFNVTGDILSSGEESIEGTDDSPDLPPLTESPTVKKL